ncbi:MAG: DNA primase [Deltaproteobacteria bacterium]|nr:DNA primase [Deltaproteobacteria bacterium]
MGNRIPENIINELRDKCDIVEHISRYVNLKKRGSNYMGLCPFHKEKTPSFVVSREKKIFHCFGCGEGGSVFNFLSKIEAKSFYQVVIELAHEKGIKLGIETESDDSVQKKNRLYAICYEAMKYYNESLYTEEGTKCLSYLKSRGITENLIIEHNLGYSPKNSEALFSKLLKLGFSNEDIMDCGIFLKQQGKIYDRFSERLVIPLIDQNKKTIGFAGRCLSEDKEVAKYINSPESIIYHKSSYLYGLNLATNHIVKLGFAILVEGYFDLISLNSINIYNVTATCGTALTQSHIKLLGRLTKDIYLCFDGDNAGRFAIYRAAKALLPSGLNVFVIPLPYGEDPDSYAIKNGHRAFIELIKNKVFFVNYLAEDVKRAISKKTHLRANLIRKMVNYIQLLPDIIEQREAIRTASNITGIEEEIIYSYLRSKYKLVQPEEIKDKKHKTYEIWLISILTQFPHLTENLPDNIIDLIGSPDIINAYREIVSAYNNGCSSNIIVSDPVLYSEVTEVVMSKTFPDNESDAFSILLDCIHRIQIDKLKSELKELDQNIISAKKSGDEKLIDVLIKKRMELSKFIQLREIKYV